MHWAEDYLGAPWSAGRDGPEAYDCYGLVRAVYRARLGVELPLLEVDAAQAAACLHAARDYGYGGWEAVTHPRELDVLTMGFARRPHHVGVYVEQAQGRVLHAVEGGGVLLQPLDTLVHHGWRVLSIYRRQA